jgi:hypothetical protein
MAFRRDGKKAFAESRRWKKWLAKHSALLASSGLPLSVLRSQDDWNYFLSYGYHCDGAYPNIDFRLEDLNGSQLIHLRRLLEQSLSDEEKRWGGAVWHSFYPPNALPFGAPSAVRRVDGKPTDGSL